MAKAGNVLTAVDQLEQALAGKSIGRIEQALAALQRLLRRRATLLTSPDDPVPDVDRPLLPSPGEDRKAARLRHELEEMLRETEALGAQARDTGLAVEAVGDRVRELIRALRTHEHAEVDLILESVNTDIGAGDCGAGAACRGAKTAQRIGTRRLTATTVRLSHDLAVLQTALQRAKGFGLPGTHLLSPQILCNSHSCDDSAAARAMSTGRSGSNRSDVSGAIRRHSAPTTEGGLPPLDE